MNLCAVWVDVGAKDPGNALVVPCGIDRSCHAADIVVLEVLNVEIRLSDLYIFVLVFEGVCVFVVLALLDVLGLGLGFEPRLK